MSASPLATPDQRDQALYSQGVAHMRKYRAPDLQESKKLFARIATPNPDIAQRPIQTLAKAAWANAVAHYPIFWQQLLFERSANNDAERMEWKRRECQRASGPLVDKWIWEVESTSSQLRDSLPRITLAQGSPPWDETAKQQLEWAIGNGLGNAYLNVATGFLQPPWPPDCGDPQPRRHALLERALREFDKCEMLLHPGVETLTNKATALLFLERYAEARDYAYRAAELNPNYEYAYFRLANSWDRESRPLQAKKVLDDCACTNGKGSVRIPEFKELFQKYNVPLPA